MQQREAVRYSALGRLPESGGVARDNVSQGPTSDSSGASVHHVDKPREAPEVVDVERDKLRDVISEHGRDDVGVVDLLAAGRHLANQQDKLMRDQRVIFSDAVAVLEVRQRRDQITARELGLRRARKLRQEFADNLPTDPQLGRAGL